VVNIVHIGTDEELDSAIVTKCSSRKDLNLLLLSVLKIDCVAPTARIRNSCLHMRAFFAIGCGTNADAATSLSGDLIEWADVIFVMEQSSQKLK